MSSVIKRARETIAIPQIPGAYYVLVVGETGSGKSTFINTVVNYFRDGEVSSEKVDIKVAVPTKFLVSTELEAELSTEASVGDSTKSKTVGAVPYVLKMLSTRTDSAEFNQKTVVMVDTPGLADTNGVAQDDANIGTILDAANRCPSIAAIILVANATAARFGINVQTTLSRLNGNIPDIALKNIVYVLTNNGNKDTSNFPVDSAPFAPKYVCYMNNSAFSSDPRTWNKRTKEYIILDWDASMFVVQELMKGIMKMGQVSTGQFAQMKEQRDLVKSALHEARCKVEELQTVQSEILDIEAKMQRAKEDQSRFEVYTKVMFTERIEWEETPYHNTLCSTCNVVCHKRCGLEEVQVAGDCRFLACAAFSGHAHCLECGGEKRCQHDVHYHARRLPHKKTETLEKILKDVKKDYDAATAGLQQHTLKMSKLIDSKKVIQASITKLSQNILFSCRGIKDICKGFNFADEMSILITQLEAHRSMLTDRGARETAQTFIDSIKAILKGLCNDKEHLLVKPGAVKPPYVTIQCNEVLEYNSAYYANTAHKKVAHANAGTAGACDAAGEASGDEDAFDGSGGAGMFCFRCKVNHTSMFACPMLGGIGAPAVGTLPIAHVCDAHPTAMHVEALPMLPSAPPMVLQRAVAPPTAPNPTLGAPPSIAAPAGFERLSGALGAEKFARFFYPKLADFESEEDLQIYAATHASLKDIVGLKEELVKDCGLSSIQAQMLASALITLSLEVA